MLGFLLMLLIPLYKILSHDTQTSPADSNHTGKTLTTILLLTISAALLLIRPLLVRTQLTGDFGLITYTILTLYVSSAAAFIIAFWLLTIPLAARNTKYEIRNTTPVEAALLCALLGVLLHNLIDFAIFEPGVLTTFWTLMACLITLDVTRTNPPQFTCTPAPSTRILAPVAALIVLALYIAHIWWPVYNSTVKIHHAQQAASVGRFDQAHALLDAAAKADPLSAAALSFNARLYVQQYRESQQPALLENAKTFFDIAIQRSPADFKNYEKLSDVYSLLGRSEQAYEWCLKATRLYPGCDRLWFNLAKIAEQLNKPALALQHYKKAVEIEDAYRNQFKIMYPQIGETVSRLGEQNYKLAKQRIKELESREL
jgi:tetratricopeptide (TPR) repeat protein